MKAVKLRFSDEEFEVLLSSMREIFQIEKIKNFLLAQDKNGANAFVYSLKNGSVSTFDAVKEFYEEIFEKEEIKEIALNKVDGLNIIAYCIENSDIESFRAFASSCSTFSMTISKKLKISSRILTTQIKLF